MSTRPTSAEAHESVYDGLLGGDESRWAFGTSFDDPLAGVDVAVPDGTDRAALATYCLMLGDDALVMAQQLSTWCSRAPDLEEDVALSNTALDLLGQARLLLARAAAADPSAAPRMPEGSPVPPEDALAFFREESTFRNVRLTEADNGDFAATIVRLMVFSIWHLETLAGLAESQDNVLRAVAVKGIKELRYHRDYAARWFVTLAQGTKESRRRTKNAVTRIWPFVDELFDVHAVEQAMFSAGIGTDPAALRAPFERVMGEIFTAANLEMPTGMRMAGVNGRAGRDGLHTESMSRLLAELQVVARAHPMGRW